MDGTPPSALFSFSGVEVERGGTQVLRGIDATIPSGGITILMGPSGAGKSTMLRLCNRLEVASAGSVCFRGEPIGDADPLRLRRRVGMVFQRPTLFEGTVRDNLRVASPDGDDGRFSDALDRADLDASFLDRVAAELSGGEAQRACIARTLVTEPEALLLDEPTSALDPSSRLAVERLCRRLADDGVPMVWVTHDLEQAERVSDHAIILVDGTLGAQGSLADIEAGATGAVRAFLVAEASSGAAEGTRRG